MTSDQFHEDAPYPDFDMFVDEYEEYIGEEGVFLFDGNGNLVDPEEYEDERD